MATSWLPAPSFPLMSATAMIDAKAVIDPGAEVDSDVSIGPYVVVGPKVRIASGCRIGQFASIEGPTTIGGNTSIYPFCSIGTDPQDKKYECGEPSELHIGKDNTIREYCSINRGTKAGTSTRMGDGNWIMGEVHIAHDCVIGDNCVLANKVTLGGHVQFGDYVTISGVSAVSQFCHVGSHAFAAGNSMIERHVPPYAFVAGDRAKYVGINSRGLARRGFDEKQMADMKKMYRCWKESDGDAGAAFGSIAKLGLDQDIVKVFEAFVRAVKDSHVEMMSLRPGRGAAAG